MSKYNYVDLNSSKMLTNLNSLNIGMESDELFINNELNFTKNININTINNKNILLPRKPEIYDANKLVLTNSTYNDFEYLQFNNRIIQTQFTQYRTDFISSGTGWRELPFSVTITPKNIHSQILISTAVYYGGSNTSADFGFRLYKKVGSGSFTEIPLAQNLDNDNKGSGVFMSNNSGADNENDNYYQYQTACVTNEFLDYPCTTDTIKYKLYCSPDLSDSNNTDVFYINRPANSTSTDNDRLHSSSYIKAQELEIYKYTDYEAPIVTEYFMNNQLYKIFTFLKDGKLVLPIDTICDYLIVAAGGGGGSSTNSSSIEGGGGGAGGLIYRENISLATGTYNIKVGDGGDAETNGEDSYIESELVPLVGYGVADNNLNAYTSSFSSYANNTYDNNIHDNGTIPRFTSWVSGAYIEYDFGSNTPVRVIHYKIFSLGDNKNAMPSSWTFQARNSTSDSWVILDTQTNITDWDDETIMHNKNINATNNKASSNPNCAKSYNVSNINKYRYYKIVFNANGGHGASLWINELALFGGSDSLFEGAKGGGGGSNIGNGNSGGSGSGGRHPDNSIGGNAISYNNGSVSTNQGYSQGINQVGIFGNQGGSGTAIFSDYFTENTLSTYTIDGRPGWTHTETHNSSDNTITIITANDSYSSLDYKFTNTPITSGIIRIRLMKTEDYPDDNSNFIYMYNSSDGIHTGYHPNDRRFIGDNHYFTEITGSSYSTIIGKRYGGIDDVDNTLTYDFDIEDQYFIFELIFNPISIELRVDGVSKGIHNFSNKDILPIDSFQLRNDQFDGKLDFIEINNTSGGGGGAGAPGNNGGDSSNFGHGGIGKRYNIRDGKTAVYYAGGGAAGRTSLIGIRSGGGLGGGGDGAPYSYTPLTDANHGGNGKANTGGGGGGSYSTHTDAYRGGKGGSGIVIVRVPQNLKNTLNIPKATGGIISYYTLGNINYCVHTFLDSGSFIPESSLQVDYLIVAGGGSGGSGGDQANEGAGGGAGGIIYKTSVTFTNSTYNVVIGKGGSENSNGENSSITGTGLTSNRIALGGGRGGHGDYPNQHSNNSISNGSNGGSGGGGGIGGGGGGTAIVDSGDTLTERSFTPNEVGVFGNNGGDDVNDTHNTGGGGGGAGGPGQNGSLEIGSSNLSGSGFGGVGKQYSIRTGSLEYYAGGGGASSGNNVNAIGALGGLGGGGKGGGGSKINQGTGNLIGEDGKPNTGGGGGGTLSGRSVKGGDGGSGIVVIRYQL